MFEAGEQHRCPSGVALRAEAEALAAAPGHGVVVRTCWNGFEVHRRGCETCRRAELDGTLAGFGGLCYLGLQLFERACDGMQALAAPETPAT
jgi:hypothetical protein